ncbi:flagellar M-ring protein FliF [Steroidobacter denitrificans]|uniref:Flagellar M-ring protein n=1 Tax=Steroidobacter denitrificans TaxID=465721 RepID=A0A127FAH5_STEDE|nr:flagellar basal-body MS-ring/collar protein FliF [Steroidobacter denitrificans]AMN46598.1 flagellar M-ring protein FliF [Steroidobacter denitrificans]
MSAEAAALRRPFLIPPNLKPLLLLLGIAAAAAAGVGVVLWSQEPNYSLLFGKLSPQDAAQIAQALESNGVPYKLDSVTGAITVPSQQVHDARLKLAGQGLPENDGGFAVLSKNSGLGVSQFMEGARYQHALEMELARTIANLQAIEAARVHLAMPRQSAFIRDRRSPSASVFLQMKPGRRLEPQQVTAIVNLVASSIPELDARQVTVVDQQGRLLSSPGGDDELAARDKQLELARSLEERYTQRVEQLLAPLVGPGRVRAQVVADVELSTTEEAREQYRPDSQIVRSEQSAEETSRNGTGPQGVPGALTNQPPVAGTALAPGVSDIAVSGAAGQGQAETAVPVPPDNVSRQSTRNYEIDRTVAYTRQPAGRLKRLSVAVLVDNQRTVAADGSINETALSSEQLNNMTRLVKDAVGFDEARGDSVNIVNAAFRGEPEMQPIEIEPVPLWERPLIRDIAKLLAGLLVLLVLVLAVLRPLVRGLLDPPRAPQASAPLPAPTDAGAPAQGAQGELVDRSIGYEERIEQARALVNQDPARVAQVVKTWVGKDE